MKRVNLIFAILGFMMLGSLTIPYILYADCGSATVACCLGGDKSKTVATTTFSMCWSWKHLECMPCHGDWSYLAAWCNSTYQGCNNQCWGCFTGNDCCFDQQGKDHNCY